MIASLAPLVLGIAAFGAVTVASSVLIALIGVITGMPTAATNALYTAIVGGLLLLVSLAAAGLARLVGRGGPPERG